MNKAKLLQKQLVKLGAIVFGVIAVSAGIMMFTGSMATEAETRKATAESARNNDNSQITSMSNQIAQSGDASKRFVDIALNHTSDDYSANTDTLKSMLRTLKDQYRFSNNFKLTLAVDKPGDNPAFSAIDYDVTVREPMKLELGAMSDTHVYSFLRQLQRDLPGLVRITKFSAERKSDLDTQQLRELSSGLNPENVGATIEFSWIGLTPKLKDAAATGGAGAAAGAPAPGGF